MRRLSVAVWIDVVVEVYIAEFRASGKMWVTCM